MSKITREMEDYLRNSRKKIIVRFDPDDVVLLPCHCRYDPKLCNREEKKVYLLRKIEILKDGSWEIYPSISWSWGGGEEGQSYTTVLVKITGEEGIDVFGSTNWCPDSTLFNAAKAAGIHVETLGN
jgi:hypothetical protein